LKRGERREWRWVADIDSAPAYFLICAHIGHVAAPTDISTAETASTRASDHRCGIPVVRSLIDDTAAIVAISRDGN
jgi:hypothetical protein